MSATSGVAGLGPLLARPEFSPPTCILQGWVMGLGLRHQGVLVAAIRGCDGMAKEDVSKAVLRELRGLILNPFDQRETDYVKSFMVRFSRERSDPPFEVLLKGLDQYPVHYLFHLIHAIEIVGYYHPTPEVQFCYRARYVALVKKLHLQPEMKEQLDERLTEDRVSNNTVES